MYKQYNHASNPSPTRTRQDLAVMDLPLEMLEPIFALGVFIDPVPETRLPLSLLLHAHAVPVADAAPAGHGAVGPTEKESFSLHLF